MALNGANAVSEALDFAWLVLGSLGRALVQWVWLAENDDATRTWADFAGQFEPVERDRPLAAEVRASAASLEAIAEGLLQPIG